MKVNEGLKNFNILGPGEGGFPRDELWRWEKSGKCLIYVKRTGIF